MVNEYNEDENMYNFLLDEESQKMLVESQIESAEERGEKRGIQKTKLKTAKRMLKKCYPLKDIAEMTGLSREYLQTLHV